MRTALPLDASNYDDRYTWTCGGRTFLFDTENGAGSFPLNAEVRHRGLTVLMKTSDFLKLAPPLGTRSRYAEPTRTGTLSHLPKVAQTTGFGPPVLYVDPERLEVGGHEGRHRATFLQAQGCTIIPVQFLLMEPHRAKHIDERALARLRRGLDGQVLFEMRGLMTRRQEAALRKKFYAPGPLFDVAYLHGRKYEWSP